MEAQFVKLLMEHRSLLHSFIYALVRDAHLAEDVLQEVGVVLWSKFGEFREGSHFGAWAREIAYREVMSARRREWRARRHLDEACARQILEAYRRREERVDAAGYRDALRACLERLSGNLRQVMDWRYGSKMSSRQIAERLSSTAPAVDALVYRGKRTLEQCIRGRLASEGISP